ncbi:MAG: hypothetical protein GX568_06020 [Candidatus Gastranaerophilales bacterium]|nr:hypothetical protein [Candidatus Gastranaerophilales bacterium]
MAELSSPGKVTAASGSTGYTSTGMTAKSVETRNIYQTPPPTEQKAKSTDEGVKLAGRNSQGDSFKPAHPTPRTASTDAAQIERLAIMRQNLRAEQQAVINTFVNAGVTARTLINDYMSKFINISDKIAAVFGDREKDIREKLSDTTKNIMLKVYEFLGKVDTSMQQQDHGHQKYTRDQEPQDSDEDSEEN